MSSWQRITVSTGASIGSAGSLPDFLVGLDVQTLANLPAALSAEAIQQLGLSDAGFLFVEDPPAPPSVPETISASQLKRFLRTMARTDGQAGTLRNQVDALVAASGDGDLQDDWEYTTDYHRQHPRLLQLAQAVHLTSDQVDAAFIAASQLT